MSAWKDPDVVGVTLWIIIFLVLAFFVNLGVAIMSFALLVTLSHVATRSSRVGKWVSGRKFNGIQKVDKTRISSSRSMVMGLILADMILFTIGLIIFFQKIKLVDILR